MKSTKAAGVIALAVISSAPLAGGAQGNEGGREISAHERKLMRVTERDVERTRRQFQRVTRKGIAWGSERPATRATVLVLDPPLERIGEGSRVDVELFVVGIDNGGGQESGWWARSTTVGWAVMLRDSRVPMRLYAQEVGQGPYLDPKWSEARKWYQKLAAGWGKQRVGSGRKNSKEVRQAMIGIWARGYREDRIESEEGIRKFTEKWKGLDFEDWKRNMEDPQIQEGMTESDRRWKEIVERGTKLDRRAFRGIPGPVLLVNGKFLLTANTMRRHGRRTIESLYQTANWLIREEWERAETQKREIRTNDLAGLTTEEIAYGSEEQARLEQVMELDRDEEPAMKGTATVEWLHDGKSEFARQVAPMMREWRRTLPGKVRFIEREASEPETRIRAGELMPSRSLRELMSRELWRKDPVMLVDGKYLIIGSRFETVREAMHTANALVRYRVEGRELGDLEVAR